MSKNRSRRVHPRAGKPDVVAALLSREQTARRAAVLARLADFELHLGHHCTAERLAHEAEALRMVSVDRDARLVGGGR